MKVKLDKEKVFILLVEDEPNNLYLLTKLLKIEGINKSQIICCDKDPSDIINNLNIKIDIVFLDIHLPKKDGYQILKELRENEKTKDSKIFAITASVLSQDIEKAKNAGFDGFIGKPIDGRRFSETFDKILNGESVWSVSG